MAKSAPPWKVDVAVVDVALMVATDGDEVPTTFPEESVESSEFLLIPDSERVTPVILEVAVKLPTVSLPILEEEKKESTRRAMFAKKEVEVACVKVAEEVAVITPAVKFPTDDEDTNSLTARSMVAKRVVVVAFVVKRVGNVEVAVVVAVKFAPTTSPTTESLVYGDVVPIPKLPSAR